MRRLIIADSHVGQRPGDSTLMCKLLERAATQEIEEIVYLGDAFQYLIGMSKFWSPAVREVLGCWDRFREHGGRIVLIEGNRDFFLDEADLEKHVDRSGMMYEFSSGNQHIRLVHGDRVNQDDRQYLFWARFSKCRTARFFAHLLPRCIAVWIVDTMEQRLARSNKKYRFTKPVKELKREAQGAWREGISLMLWGHFHSFWETLDGPHRAMVVPAWLENSTALLIESNGDWALVDSKLNSVAMPVATSNNTPET